MKLKQTTLEWIRRVLRSWFSIPAANSALGLQDMANKSHEGRGNGEIGGET